MGSDAEEAPEKLYSEDFNPRSPCGERLLFPAALVSCLLFQSTLPVWGATLFPHGQHGDKSNFNPRSPCGERLVGLTALRKRLTFQSTLPVWGATGYVCKSLIGCLDFNPRSPCGERLTAGKLLGQALYFNPRSPCGERPFVNGQFGRFCGISIHAPRVGSDQYWTKLPDKQY